MAANLAETHEKVQNYTDFCTLTDYGKKDTNESEK